MFWGTVACLLLAAKCVLGAHLASYITPCKRNDPELSKCIVERANEVIPKMINGDKEHHFPNLNPLEIPQANLEVGSNFHLKLINMVSEGFDTSKLLNGTMDFENQIIRGSLYMEHMLITADYEISGQILLMPVTGKGVTRLDFIKPIFDVMWKYKMVEKRGEAYMWVTETSINYKLERTHFIFENLFNGNKELGDNINNVLNENWEAVHNDFSPAIAHVIQGIVHRIAKAIVNSVPLNEIFV